MHYLPVFTPSSTPAEDPDRGSGASPDSLKLASRALVL